MEVLHSLLNLSDFGFIDSYDLSGDGGELTYEFPPPDIDVDSVAIAIVDGDNDSTIHLESDTQDLPTSEFEQRRSDTGSLAIIPKLISGIRARFRYRGDKPVTIHFAIFRKVKKSISDLVKNAIDRFSEQCWACKKLVRFFISLIMSGGFDDIVENGLDFLWEKFADIPEMVSGMDASYLGKILKRIINHLDDYLRVFKIWDPRNKIAEAVCKELEYCKPS